MTAAQTAQRAANGTGNLAKRRAKVNNTQVKKAAPRKSAATRSTKALAGNFGVLDETAPHFRVNVPRSRREAVEISDVLPDEHGMPVQEARVLLTRQRWDLVAQRLEQFLNRRLREDGQQPGKWRSGLTIVRRDLGKEITLLCWAIEEAQTGSFDLALGNWEGLEPEERWWLYTQTAAATGDATTGKGRGWRKAIRYALTDNPLATETRQTRRAPGYFQQAATEGMPSLFDTSKD